MSAKLTERAIAATVELVKQSKRFDGLKLPEDLARKMKLLRLSLTVATPSDPKESEELTRILAGMEGTYGKGKYCKGGQCLDLEDITKIMAQSRNRKELEDVWGGWHTIAPPLRQPFQRYVELANKGARELGFADTGAMWRAKYDMAPDAFAKELDRLWEQVRPLYLSLHAYVRTKLREKYGDARAGERPDPGAPAGEHVGAGVGEHLSAGGAQGRRPRLRPDANPEIEEDRAEADGEVRREVFHVAGFAPLPETFWERSLFTKPRDREVVCHASAWDVDNVDDLRIKMCIDITERGLHHHPPRAGPQFLPARLQQAAVPVPRQRQRRLPRGDRRHDRALGDAGVSGEDRTAGEGAGHVEGHRTAADARRWRRWRFCRSGC